MGIIINDVAKKANVSKATVSKVFNNSKEIGEKTRLKVLKAIKELDYHPSAMARGLSTKKTGNLAFMLNRRFYFRSEAFYTRILRGAELRAEKYGYHIILSTIDDKMEKKRVLSSVVREKKVDGVILAGKIDNNFIKNLNRTGIPIVLVDYHLGREKINCVLIDNVGSAYEAVMHLGKKGHKRIGLISGFFEHPSPSERWEGYKMALQDLGLPYDEELVITDEKETDVDNGYHAMKKILQLAKVPTAIFAQNDWMAIGAMKAIREKGLDVPRDISIVGFDDVEAGLHAVPPLTTVRVYKEEMGGKAVDRLLEMMGDKTTRQEKIVMSTELVVRSSVEAR